MRISFHSITIAFIIISLILFLSTSVATAKEHETVDEDIIALIEQINASPEPDMGGYPGCDIEEIDLTNMTLISINQLDYWTTIILKGKTDDMLALRILNNHINVAEYINAYELNAESELEGSSFYWHITRDYTGSGFYWKEERAYFSNGMYAYRDYFSPTETEPELIGIACNDYNLVNAKNSDISLLADSMQFTDERILEELAIAIDAAIKSGNKPCDIFGEDVRALMALYLPDGADLETLQLGTPTYFRLPNYYCEEPCYVTLGNVISGKDAVAIMVVKDANNTFISAAVKLYEVDGKLVANLSPYVQALITNGASCIIATCDKIG